MSNDLEQFIVQAAPTAKIQIEDPTSSERKVAFLAHILTGAPFMVQYDIANVGFVEFATVSSTELNNLRQLAYKGVHQEVGAEKLKLLLAVACVNRLEVDGRIVKTVHERTWGNTFAYDMFVDRLPVGLFQIIESYYGDFSSTLSYLIGKVSDRSFWPTP